MTVVLLDDAERDLRQAFEHYQSVRIGLGVEMLDEFRRGVELILTHPNAWQALDTVYRRYRLHRFPYGVVYRVDAAVDRIVISAFAHLHRKPGWWKER